MDHSITLRDIEAEDMITAKARSDFILGRSRESHGFSRHAYRNIAMYQAKWDLCAAAYSQQRAIASKLGMETPP